MQFTEFSFKYDVIGLLAAVVRSDERMRQNEPGTPDSTVRSLLAATIYHWHARCDGCGQVITSLDGAPDYADRNSWLHHNGTRSCKSAISYDAYPGGWDARRADTRLARPDRASRDRAAAGSNRGTDGCGTDVRGVALFTEGCHLCEIGRELLEHADTAGDSA